MLCARRAQAPATEAQFVRQRRFLCSYGGIMNPRATAQLGLGLLGIWAFIDALLLFPQLATSGAYLSLQRGLYAPFIGMLLPFLVLLVLAYVLVFHTPTVAQRVLPLQETAEAEPHGDLAPVLVGLVGVWIFLGSLPGVLQTWAVREGFQVAAGLQLRSGIASGARALVGLAMILRPGIFADLWRARPQGSGTGGAA